MRMAHFRAVFCTFTASKTSNRMKQKHITLLLLAVVTLLTMGSCKKDLFDKETYTEAVDDQFRVDNIDKNHDWCLTKNDTITIKTPDARIYSVQIITGDPRTASRAEIAAEGVCYGNQAVLNYTVPVVITLIYIAALDQNGNYLGIVGFSYGTKEIELTLDILDSSGSFNQPNYQTFTYIYDSSFPMPDDFDYNDMVLRISKKTPNLANSVQVDLTVTMEACGADQIYAAAIQLVGISYDDVSKVEVVEGEPMDKDYPNNLREFIRSDESLLRGIHGEAVINLFDCAQWVFNKNFNEMGEIPIIRYNTTREAAENYSAKANPVTTTYRITFKNRDKARSMTFNTIDPFIIHRYTSNYGLWEVHTYAHKFDSTLIQVNSSAYDNHISWSVIVPKADFRYPLEGISLCNFNSNLNETFGPYEGFAGWMKDHTSNRNWYLHLDRPQLVY